VRSVTSLTYTNHYAERKVVRCETGDETVAYLQHEEIVAMLEETVCFDVVFKSLLSKVARTMYVLLKDHDGGIEQSYWLRCTPWEQVQ